MPEHQQNLFGEGFNEPEPWELAAEEDRWGAEVALNVPVDQLFSYLVPDPLRDKLHPGQRVKVPFGRGSRTMTGFCVRVGPVGKVTRKLKEVAEVIDREPLIDQQMLDLTEWIGKRYLCGWGQVLESVIPAGVKKLAGTREVKLYQVAEGVDENDSRLTKKQAGVVTALLYADRPLRGDELADAANCGTSPIKTLEKKGILVTHNERQSKFEAEIGHVEKEQDLKLHFEQMKALKRILHSVRGGEHETILLHGVTGSGKTEVYIQAIREVVSYGRQAIVLVPEISLTPQTIRRFRSRFDSVAVLHSHLTDSERHYHWKRIAGGDVQVIVGARSAIFAPAPRLGLVIIDEEHETSFKQETTPRYHAREVARKRCQMLRVPLILGTATPTLESWRRVEEKQDVLLSMPNRVNGLPLPPVSIIDTRQDQDIRRGAAIGRQLVNGMKMALKDGGQVILFLNLRGFSTTIWCRACGESVKCSECDISLTWHRDRRKALCHSCGFETDPPEACPHCQHPGLKYVGIGTQKLEQEVNARFPGVPCVRMDSDSMRQHGSHDRALEAFRHGKTKILLGTQMIAKGLDFPNVTLVGVIDADTTLRQPDWRASERTFHLLAQVAGRTGRSERGGRVYIQTACPEEPPIVKAAHHDFLGFAEIELEHREEMGYPPYSCLSRIIFRGEIDEEVQAGAKEIATVLRETIKETGADIEIRGPAPAPIVKLKKFYRHHLQIVADDFETLRELWLVARDIFPTLSNVDYQIDVDAINLR
ncbi:MAG: primosomal protein N' [Planctomycetaceae bacterium]|nr:primosomal protein N' [Planctomycetaceae bacterium]